MHTSLQSLFDIKSKYQLSYTGQICGGQITICFDEIFALWQSEFPCNLALYERVHLVLSWGYNNDSVCVSGFCSRINNSAESCPTPSCPQIQRVPQIAGWALYYSYQSSHRKQTFATSNLGQSFLQVQPACCIMNVIAEQGMSKPEAASFTWSVMIQQRHCWRSSLAPNLFVANTTSYYFIPRRYPGDIHHPLWIEGVKQNLSSKHQGCN